MILRLIGIILLSVCVQVNAETFSIESLTKDAELVGEYLHLQDKSVNDFKQVEAIPLTDPRWKSFKKVKRIYSNTAEWYFFTIKNNLDQKVTRTIQYPFGMNEELHMHIYRSNGEYEHKSALHSMKIMERNRMIRRPTVDLELAAGEEVKVYMQMKSYHIISMAIEISDPAKAVGFDQLYKAVSSIYVGVLFALFFYNLFVVMVLRDPNIYYYLGVLVSVGAMILTIADIPIYYHFTTFEWMRASVQQMNAISGIFLVVLTRSFLKTKIGFKKTDYALRFIQYSFAIMFVIGLFPKTLPFVGVVVQNLITLCLVTLIASSFYVAFKTRKRYAFIYALALGSLFTTGIVYYMVWNFGLLSKNFVTGNIILLGSAMEMILFSIAIADNFKFQITNAQVELEQLNSKLEAKVKEKTEHLIEAEKRAATAQLAGKVADELNSPLSAVYGIIERIENNDGISQLTMRAKDVMNRIFDITSSLQIHGKGMNELPKEPVMTQDYFEDETRKVMKVHMINRDQVEFDLSDQVLYCHKRFLGKALRQLIQLRFENFAYDSHMKLKGYEEDGNYVLEIKDNGPDFDLEFVEKFNEDPAKLSDSEVKSGLEFLFINEIFSDHKANIIVGGPKAGYNYKIIFNSELQQKQVA
jgi:signal transduction histidine kinase